MKKEKYVFNIFISIGGIMLLLCISLLVYTLYKRNINYASSWASATGTLSAALVALWGTMHDDMKNKERRYNQLSLEVKHLKNLRSELLSAQDYNPDEYLRNHPNSYADTWSQNWHDHIPQLIELQEILKENDMSSQSLNDFIEYINSGNERMLNDQIVEALLHLKLIYEWKEQQLKDMK